MEAQAGADGPASSTATAQDTFPSPRPLLTRSPASNPNLFSLPPLTTTLPARTPGSGKKPSYADKRMSSFSANSIGNPSRPQSNAFPFFLSSLPYALVRDFAYPIYNQLHYGPPPDQPSAVSTPASEHQRRVSDPLSVLRWGGSRMNWSAEEDTRDASYFGPQLHARSFVGDGPPYAEDADLLSPIVTATKHKKTKSNLFDYNRSVTSAPAASDEFHGVAPGGGVLLPNGQTSEPYAAHASADEQLGSLPNPSNRTDPSYIYRYTSQSATDEYLAPDQMAGHYYDEEEDDDESRLSRAYQFTIASPDEEYHGKAVALFDFSRENDNELPFVEGQVLWVSYRHGEGWLVAQDPKSGESGLIPEEYVRLLRDIEGGLRGLNGGDTSIDDEADFDTPVDSRRPLFHGIDYGQGSENGHARSNSGNHYAPVLSHFTTSSKDLQPYPVSHTHSLSAQAEDNTPVPNHQSTFGGQATFFDDRPDEEESGELLSPETFKREESFGTRERKPKETAEIIENPTDGDSGGSNGKVEAPVLAS